MKTQTTIVHLLLRPLRVIALASVCLLLGRESECRAVTLYDVTITTTAWTGLDGTLAFDLVGGDALAANNTASIGDFSTDGTLSSLADITLTDTDFFNEVLRDMTFGTQLSFTLQLTENHAAPGLDEFSFFLLDPTTLVPLGATTDPTGADAVFAVDATGGGGGNKMVFDSLVDGVSWTLRPQNSNNVPDGASTLALACCALGALACFRFTLGKRRASLLRSV